MSVAPPISSARNKGPTLHLTFRAMVDCVPQARHQLMNWLDDLQVDRSVVDDLALAATELMTNAVEASPTQAAQVTLRATFRDPDVLLEVTDEGQGFELQESPRPPGPQSPRGRGLPIVRALVDLVEVQRSRNQTRVVATRRLSAPRI